MAVRGVVVEPCNTVYLNQFSVDVDDIFGIIGTVLCVHEPVGEV